MRNSGNEDRKGFHEEFPLLRFERDQDQVGKLRHRVRWR
jgi:hypothetical protein